MALALAARAALIAAFAALIAAFAALIARTALVERHCRDAPLCVVFESWNLELPPCACKGCCVVNVPEAGELSGLTCSHRVTPIWWHLLVQGSRKSTHRWM